MKHSLAAAPFNPLRYPLCLASPRKVDALSWHEHIPFAMALVQMLSPRVIVELGVHTGDSYLAFCQAVAETGGRATAYGVDTWTGDAHAGLYGPEVLERLRTHHDPLYGGFSRLVQSTFDEAARHFGDGSVDLLHIDGFHEYEAISHDWETWKPKLSARGVALFHDTHVRERDFGVWRLWRELTAMMPGFDFAHGHGLGVLAVGPGARRLLGPLLNADEQTAATLREFFFALGSRITLTAKVNSAEAALVELKARCESLGAALTGAQTTLGACELTLQARDVTVGQLEEKLSELQALVAAQDEDLSVRDAHTRELERALQNTENMTSDLRRELAESRVQIQAFEESQRNGADQVSSLIAEREELASIARRVPLLEESLRKGADRMSSLIAERDALATTASRVPLLEESLREHAHRLSMLVTDREKLLSSTSWRLTSPFRSLATQTRTFLLSVRSRTWDLRTRLVRIALGRWRRDARIISDSGLFDATWYAERNPDVVVSGLTPLEHFAKYGGAEMRDPHPLFSTRRYLQDNPDVARSGVNAVVHFVRRGRAEGRRAYPARSGSARPLDTAGPLDLRFSVSERRLPSRPTPPGPDKLPVLCVTHVPPWPPRAGNEYRIARLLAWLAARGHPILVVVAPPDGQMPGEKDLEEMVRRYGNVVVSLPDGRVDARLTRPGLSLLELHGQAFAAGEGGGSALANLERSFCHDALVGIVLELERRVAPCVLYVNYIFMTRFLPLTSGRSVSFVDTIDVFSTKDEKVLRFGIADPLSLSPEEEARCLRRADAIVAIQAEEAAALASLVPDRPVLTVGVDFDTEAGPDLPSDATVVCVASDNALNARGLRDLLRFAWPTIRREVPGARLLLAGKGASTVELGDADTDIEVRGVVDDVAPLYREARVAINPAVAGTGLKIKTMEALRHFRPIVTWPHGVDGVTDRELLKLCRVVGDWYEFAWCTVDALRGDVALPDAEAQARIRHALSAEAVYADLGRWLDDPMRAARPGDPAP